MANMHGRGKSLNAALACQHSSRDGALGGRQLSSRCCQSSARRRRVRHCRRCSTLCSQRSCRSWNSIRPGHRTLLLLLLLLAPLRLLRRPEPLHRPVFRLERLAACPSCRLRRYEHPLLALHSTAQGSTVGYGQRCFRGRKCMGLDLLQRGNVLPEKRAQPYDAAGAPPAGPPAAAGWPVRWPSGRRWWRLQGRGGGNENASWPQTAGVTAHGTGLGAQKKQAGLYGALRARLPRRACSHAEKPKSSLRWPSAVSCCTTASFSSRERALAAADSCTACQCPFVSQLPASMRQQEGNITGKSKRLQLSDNLRASPSATCPPAV